MPHRDRLPPGLIRAFWLDIPGAFRHGSEFDRGEIPSSNDIPIPIREDTATLIRAELKRVDRASPT